MNTILILAQALAKVSTLNIDRLDFQYDHANEEYFARVWLTNEDNKVTAIYNIKEDGTITK